MVKKPGFSLSVAVTALPLALRPLRSSRPSILLRVRAPPKSFDQCQRAAGLYQQKSEDEE